MHRPLSAKQLEALRQKQVEIARRVKEGEKDVKTRHREAELRREAIVGRLVLNMIGKDSPGPLRQLVLALIDRHIKRPADRALFPDLPAAGKAAAEAPEEDSGGAHD